MTKVLFKLSDFGSTGRLPTNAHITFKPTKLHVEGDTIITAKPFNVKFSGDVAVDLDPTTSAWAWHIQVTDNFTPITDGFHWVPNQKEILYTELSNVSPGDLEADSAWQAMARSTVNGGEVVNGDLILSRTDGKTVNVGRVTGKDGTGKPGPITTLTGGTVTKLPPGSTPTAELVGNLNSKRLNLGLTTGDPGQDGLNGSNVLPDSQAVAQAITLDGPAKTALSTAIVQGGVCRIIGGFGQSNITPADSTIPVVAGGDVKVWKWTGSTIAPVPASEVYLLPEVARLVSKGLSPQDWVLIVRQSYGSTGFTTTSLSTPPAGYVYAEGGTWDRTLAADPKNLALAAVQDMKNAYAAASAAGAKSVVYDSVLLSQGEADTLRMTKTQYTAKLDDFIDYVRTELGVPDLPWVIGSMVPEYTEARTNPYTADIAAALAETPMRKHHTSFVYGPRNAVQMNGSGGSTIVHWATAGQVERARMFRDALPYARVNTADSKPVSVQEVRVRRETGKVTAEWDQPLCRVSAFAAELSEDGITWTPGTINSDTNLSASWATSAASMQVRVRVRNDEALSGAGAWSPYTYAVLDEMAAILTAVFGAISGLKSGVLADFDSHDLTVGNNLTEWPQHGGTLPTLGLTGTSATDSQRPDAVTDGAHGAVMKFAHANLEWIRTTPATGTALTPQDGLTICLRVKVNALPPSNFASLFTAGPSQNISIDVSAGGNLRAVAGTAGNSALVLGAATTGEYMTVVLTIRSGNAALYKDGKLLTAFTSNATELSRLNLGANASGTADYSSQMVRRLRVYGRSLNSTEIMALNSDWAV